MSKEIIIREIREPEIGQLEDMLYEAIFLFTSDFLQHKFNQMDKLHILWTSDNKITVLNMLAIYVLNAKSRGWWKEINVIIWGASAKLVAKDTQVQTEVLEMLNMGISVEACKDCSDVCEVTDDLERLGVNVRFMGEPLTNYIKSGEPILTI